MNINLRGDIICLDKPVVMGILNVTPDSFYANSRYQGEYDIQNRIEQIISQGAKIIDIGGYSSRPDATYTDTQEEKQRLKKALDIMVGYRDNIYVSIDSFRSDIIEWAYEYYGIDIVNDISGGEIDKNMFSVVSRLQIPYILMHMRGTPQTMMQNTDYNDRLIEDILDYFIQKVGELRDMGLHDIILDPGFGFSKTLIQNYELMSNIDVFKTTLELPILVGISRKSMIYKRNGTSATDALNGTTTLNMYALTKGAGILRVHDVKEAVEVCEIFNILQEKEIKDNSIHSNWYNI